MEENEIKKEHVHGENPHGENAHRKHFHGEASSEEGARRERHHGKHRHHHEHDRRQEKKGDDLVHIEDLYVEYTAGKKIVHAVNGVTFDIKRGEAVALVGESGCGKSTIAKAILRILPDHGARMGGKIIFEDDDLVTLPEKEMENIRGDKISMVFQDPMTALNPVKKIITQVSGVIRLHNPQMSKADAKEQAMQMLELVGITRDRVNDYPHQFSGGQQQRVVVAIGLACDPDLLLADEPTTALDVTIQAQVLDMMTSLIRKTNTAMLMITHNLGIVAETCDYVAVLYGGEIVEYGSKREIFKEPTHPYTIGLFGALPDLHGTGNRLKPIEGIMPEPSDLPAGCKFHTRCPYATDACSEGPVPMVELGGTHRCQCHNIDAVLAANKKED
jgi:peptide/nickel transport system ATP-binding protein